MRMGTLLYTDDGEELSEHEGYLEFRLREPLVVPPMFRGGEPDRYEGWTSTWVAGIEELRCAVRAGCDCGWRGPELPWPGGEPSEEQHDALMEVWYDDHADPIRQQLGLLGPIVDANAGVIEANRILAAAVRRARDGGASWNEIGGALGVSKQTAWDRYGKDQQS
jgi:hypothetical protein